MPEDSSGLNLRERLEQVERSLLLDCLRKNDGNQTLAARELETRHHELRKTRMQMVDGHLTGNLRTVYFWPEQLKGHIERVYHPGQ